jgi:hypothetical protein
MKRFSILMVFISFFVFFGCPSESSAPNHTDTNINPEPSPTPSPSPSPSPSLIFINNGNDTMTDTRAGGLTWLKTMDTGSRDWYAADSYCAGLDFAGHTDWRMPTLAEYSAAFSVPVGYIGSLQDWMGEQGFTVQTVQTFFWTSDPVTTRPGYYWGFVFYSRNQQAMLPTTPGYGVWAVR